jgi:hypothetical protein
MIIELDRGELCFLITLCCEHISDNSSPKLPAIAHKLVEALASESTAGFCREKNGGNLEED